MFLAGYSFHLSYLICYHSVLKACLSLWAETVPPHRSWGRDDDLLIQQWHPCSTYGCLRGQVLISGLLGFPAPCRSSALWASREEAPVFPDCWSWNSISTPWVQSKRRASVSWAMYDRNRASAALGWVGGQDTGSLPLPGWSCSHIWGHGGEQESSYHSWLLLPEVEHARQCFHKMELEGGEEERNHGSDATDSCSHQI